MKDTFTNDQVLEALRDFQERGSTVEPMSFAEWRDNGGMERDIAQMMEKARGSGIAGMGHYSPGFGMMGALGTSSRAPAGPNARRSGNQGVGFGGNHTPRRSRSGLGGNPITADQQFGVPNGITGGDYPSKYMMEATAQPQPWIDDVDMESIWYSPFQPVWPFGPPYYNRPREWNFPVGYNLNFIPARLELVENLRGMRSSWGVMATVIETRKDQLLRLPWTIQRREKPRQSSKGVEEVRKFFKRPDGKLTFGQWARKLLDDSFVIDGPSIFLDRNRIGGVRMAEVIDGGTIFPLIDDAGRRPDTIYDMTPQGLDYIKRQPAFQQIIYGLPMVDLSEDQLIYAMMRPLPQMPMFGFSPVNQIMIEATEAIRKTFYQLEFWRSGSMPELIVTVPDGWTPRQIAAFQGHFDALLSGQLSLKSKVRFVPGGMKPFDIKNASGESLWSDRDEMLVRLCCYAFSVSPTPFVKQTNRGTATNQAQSAQEEGLYPLMSWWKDDVMDRIIEECGYDDIEFVFQPRPEVDLEKGAKIHQIKIEAGMMTLDEARAEDGLEPYPDGMGAVPMIYTGNGAVRLEDAAKGLAMGGVTPNSDNTNSGSDPTKSKGSIRSKAPARPANTPERGGASPTPSNKPTPVHKAELLAQLTEALEKVNWKDIKDAGKDVDQDPSHKQKHIGNYRKGHITVQGLDITIENPKGSKRNGKDRDGNKWKVKQPATYGYIKGTIGADNEHMDVYLGKHPEDPIVYVIDQDIVDSNGKPLHFDEHKCFVGFKNPKKVIRCYLKAHLGGKGLDICMAVTALSMVEFKSWLKDGEHDKPISEQGVGTVIAKRGDDMIHKMDTVSASTGLTNYDLGPRIRRMRRRKRKGQMR